MEFPMLIQLNKLHPALKHAGYSATTLLPGEDPAAFEKLHRALIHELAPVGTLEEEIVADMARLTWRNQNLATFQTAEVGKKDQQKNNGREAPPPLFFGGGGVFSCEKSGGKKRTRRRKEKTPERPGGHL